MTQITFFFFSQTFNPIIKIHLRKTAKENSFFFGKYTSDNQESMNKFKQITKSFSNFMKIPRKIFVFVGDFSHLKKNIV